MRGSLSPSVLAKNKRNAVFRLVIRGEASESVPRFRPILFRKNILILYSSLTVSKCRLSKKSYFLLLGNLGSGLTL